MKRRVALAAVLFSLVAVASCWAWWGSKPAWRFIVVGDSRGNDEGINKHAVAALRDAILLEQPAFVLFPGDLVQGYAGAGKLTQQLTTWKTVFAEPLAQKGIAVYPVRGNHDVAYGVGDPAKDPWRTVLAGDCALPTNGPEGEVGYTYAFEHRGILFLNLDTYFRTNQVNVPWVAQQVAAHPGWPVFSQTHEPLFPLRSGHQDALSVRPADRDAFVDLLTTNAVAFHFCGHDHWYAHSSLETNGAVLHQFTVGTAGAPPGKPGRVHTDVRATNIVAFQGYGYLVVDIDGSTANFTAYRLTDEETFEVAERYSSPIPAPRE